MKLASKTFQVLTEPSNECEVIYPVKLKRQAHLQNGLYIAAINEGGYLGDVMYKVKQK